MPIDADTAVRLAAERGLSLADARALSLLADDETHAGRLLDAHMGPRSSRAQTKGLPPSGRAGGDADKPRTIPKGDPVDAATVKAQADAILQKAI